MEKAVVSGGVATRGIPKIKDPKPKYFKGT